MGIADDLLGRTVAGQRKGTAWTIHEKIAQTPGNTPGQFSVAYKCRNEAGLEAFLKASDLSKVLGASSTDIVGNILRATTAHDFERQILDRCSGNAMDRVVTAIDFGSEHANHNGAIDVLFFLIFELAEGDLRKRVEKHSDFDLLWIVSAMHDFSVAVSQLHSGLIYHNDLKPANGLLFGATGAKVADLGRATTPHIPVAHDRLQCAGDRRFAPPEQLYKLNGNYGDNERFNAFRAGDLYNLGSIGHYLITGRSVTIEVLSRLRQEFKPHTLGGGWTDTIDEVMPHWNAIFLDLMEELNDSIPEDTSKDHIEHFNKIKDMIASLCEPYVSRRGYPTQIGRANQYDLQRYVSALDLQRRQIMVLNNRGK